ncbi:MAG: hypothetical protein FD162_395 [Rhodobacteraceae bacterium]|uniref:hypothetical protein n=1 Tax=Cypionkella sp. TaxID=2811411 RepID=UPI0013230569|nr:hypothetical protein [Cypionkella sp.]KAF0175828.1 MAG: hypothetical protein FD162_395 [Paracoccaceae bacterium]MDO8325583.1 hypothetical protein [Cypionkella sp.]
MRLAAMFVAVVLSGTPLLAQPKSTDGMNDNEVWNAACAQVGDVAESIMQLRLKNTPMSDLMKRTDETVGKGTTESARSYAAFLKRLVVAAYEKPAYVTEENRVGAVQEFRNEAELACYSGGIR